MNPAVPAPPGPLAAPPSRGRVTGASGMADLLVFRVGAELFGLPLEHVEEVVEVGVVHPVPEAGGAALGVVELHGRMVPVLSPGRALGVAPNGAAVLLVLRSGSRRVGIAIDDVEDVLSTDVSALHPPPEGEAGDGVLLAIARRGTELVGVLDPELFLAACLGESRPTETAA